MKLRELYFKQPVITLDELDAYLEGDYSQKKRSREALVSYHLREGNLVRIRRGLYALVPPGNDPETYPIDPYLVAAKSANDAVLAYHTALDIQGKAHSVFEQYLFQSARSLHPATFRDYHFKCILYWFSVKWKTGLFC